MLKNAFLAMCLMLGVALVSCEKPPLYDSAARAAQLKLDVDSIARFVAANNIAATNDGSGLYSQVLTAGSGNISLDSLDLVTLVYTGRLLDGLVVERATEPDSVLYSSLIQGLKMGLKKIQPGGRIRLIIPSTMAYTNKVVGAIPANSNLDYTIQLIKVTKNKPITTK